MAELAVDEGSTTRGGEEKDVDGGEETVPALARESSAELAFYRDFWRQLQKFRRSTTSG